MISTCLAESVDQALSLGSLQVKVVVLLVGRLQVEGDVLEYEDVACRALSCALQLLLQPGLVSLLQLRAAGRVKEELGVQHQEQHPAHPETEIVVPPATAVLLHRVRSGRVAKVVVATDENEGDIWISVPQSILQVSLLFFPESAT